MKGDIVSMGNKVRKLIHFTSTLIKIIATDLYGHGANQYRIHHSRLIIQLTRVYYCLGLLLALHDNRLKIILKIFEPLMNAVQMF